MGNQPWPQFQNGIRERSIAEKECHRNYVLISKEQHWRSPAKKLEKYSTTRLQGCQDKARCKEKLKLIWINLVYG